MLRLFLFSKKKIDLDVDKVKADTYFRTTDGVLHLNEVKNTPNAFVSKLLEGVKKENGQFKRYADWVEKGAKQGQVREAIVYIKNSKPNFHRIIDKDVLDALSDTLAKNNVNKIILQIGERKFSYRDLEELTADSSKMLKKIKKNTGMGIGDILKKHFDSLEETLKTVEPLGKTYGY